MHADSASRVRLWYTRADSLTDAQLNAGLTLLPEAQQQHFLVLHTDKRRREYLISRLLICTALSQVYSGPRNSWTIKDCADAAPNIANLPHSAYISLSHSHQLIAFALSPAPVGLDVEQVKARQNINDLAKMFMNPVELDQLPSDPDQAQRNHFYRLWCAKEAFYKALPSEQQARTPLNTLDYASLASNTGDWHLHETRIGNYQSALVTRAMPNMSPPRIQTLKLF